MAKSQCSICSSGSLEAVNAALKAHTPVRQIGARFGISSSAIWRHLDRCLRPAADQAALEEGDDQADVHSLLRSLERLKRRAEASGNTRLVFDTLKQMAELRRRLMPIARPSKREVRLHVTWEKRYSDRVLLVHLKEFMRRTKSERLCGMAARLAAAMMNLVLPADLDAEISRLEAEPERLTDGSSTETTPKPE